jgi:hypothetical protein
MAIHSTHLETLQPVIATALNIVKNRTLADLYVPVALNAAAGGNV